MDQEEYTSWLSSAVCFEASGDLNAALVVMSLSDCIRCWDTPCMCDWEYRAWSETKLQKHIQMLENLLKDKLIKEKSRNQDHTICEG